MSLHRIKGLALIALLVAALAVMVGQGWRSFGAASRDDGPLAVPSAGHMRTQAGPGMAAADVRALASNGVGVPTATLATGPVNIGFAQDMSLHHEQALYMARLALAQGTPRVRGLAEGIVNQQLKEIGYMQGWLLLWDAPAASETDDMRWMKDAYTAKRQRDPVYEQFIESCQAGQGMPGMAKPEELENLATLKGDAFDGRFLAMMIRHHQGAVVMARFSAEHAEAAAVQGFARTVFAEQRREMQQMMTLLTALQRGQ